MQAIHLPEFHVPKGSNLFFLCVGALICLVLALFTFAIAALVGGQAYADQLGGLLTLWLVLGGVALAALGAFVTKPQ